MDGLVLGPLVLPWSRLQVALGLLVFLGAAWALGRRHPILWPWAQNAVLLGLLGARLGFVLEHWPVYARDPLAALYVWQGVFSPFWGILLAGGYTLRRLPKGLWPYALLASLLGVLALAALWQGRPRAEGSLPGLTLYTLGGSPVSLEAFKGKPLVLNLWATWCPPCRRELPMMLRVAGETPGVGFAFASQGETREAVRLFLDQNRLEATWVLLDPGASLSQALKAQGLPTTFFFDREGRLVARHLGEISEAVLLGYLRMLAR